MADEGTACLHQLVEKLEQLAFSRLSGAALRLDALSDVLVEEVYSPACTPVRGRCVVAAELDQIGYRHARGDELHARRDRLQVLGREEWLVTSLDRDQQACRLQAVQKRRGHPAPFGQLVQRQRLWADRASHRCDQRLVRRLQLAIEEAPDHGEGESPLLQVADAPKSLEMAVAIPRHAAFAPRGLQEPFALVEADRVDGHAGCPGQLFDPILHEYLL